jgi:hypothetical protein
LSEFVADLKQLRINVVDMANANLGKLDGTTAPIREIIEGHDVVFGVWQDLTQPDGVDMLLIKGSRACREVIASGSAARVKISAIPCECYEQAIAAQRAVGDGGGLDA